MPLYEYECQQCHRHTEKIQKFSDPEITTCPHCGGPLQRVITAPAFALKGGGWYADGYGSAKPAADAAGGAAKADAPAAKSESAGGDATPAAAPVAAPAPSAAPSASSGEKA